MANYPTDYILLHKNFRMRIKTYHITNNSRELYQVIFDRFNAAFWVESLSLDRHSLCGEAGLSLSEFIRCRQELVDEGYVVFTPGGGRADGTYRLVKLYSEQPVYKITQEFAYSPPNEGEEKEQSPACDKGTEELVFQKRAKFGTQAQHKPIIYNKTKTKEREIQPLSPPESPPSLEEVEAFCKENKLSVSAAKFVNHFNRLGWVDNNNRPVLNWRAKISTWDNFEIPAVHGKDRASNREYPKEAWAALIDNLEDIEM